MNVISYSTQLTADSYMEKENSSVALSDVVSPPA